MKKIFAVALALVMMVTMMVPVFAATDDFVPSIEIKPGPGVVVRPNEEGVIIGGEIITPDGEVIEVPEVSIIVTPFGGAENADDETKKALDEAFDDLSKADSIKDVIEGLEDVIDAIIPGGKVEDLIISDLFHVDVDGNYDEYVEEGGVVKVTYELPDDKVIPVVKVDGKWQPLSSDKYVINADGTITITVTPGTIVAFLKDSGVVNVDPENPGQSSPVTGVDTTAVAVIAVLFAGAAVAFFASAKKQNA